MPATHSQTARRAAPSVAMRALSLGLAVALGLGPMAAHAQQKPAQRPAPQQPAQQGQAPAGPTVVQVKPEPSQTSWTKVCGKDEGANKEICYTTRDFVSDQNQPVLAVAIYDVKGDATKIVRFLMPLGLLLRPGIRFGIDSQQPTAGQYAICFPNGCFAEAQVREDVINQMKKGNTLNVSVQNQAGAEVSFAIPLADFAKGFDGPAIDPKVLEQQQKQLQDELTKRQEELRQKLGGGAASPAAPAPGAAPAPAPAPKQ